MSKFDEGDDSEMLHADVHVLPGGIPVGGERMPIGVQRSYAKALIASFLKRRQFHDSARGGLVWVILEYCNEKGLPYTIRRASFGSWHVLLDKPMPPR